MLSFRLLMYRQIMETTKGALAYDVRVRILRAYPVSGVFEHEIWGRLRRVL